MNDHPVPDPAPVVSVRVPFTFEAVVRERYGRKDVRKVYSALAALQLKSAPLAKRAYSIELGPGESVDILFYQGRLLWPMNYVTPFRRVVNGDALCRLQDGTLDLFADGKYDRHADDFEHDASIVRVVWSGYEEAVARVWRRANACVMVAGELYGVGGVPIFVPGPAALNRGVHVANSGACRDAEPRHEGLWTQPGGFHLPLVQRAVARGHFCLAVEASRNTSSDRYPRVVAHRNVSVDVLDLRVDATFREFVCLLEPTEERVREHDNGSEFPIVDRTGSHSDLTAARCDALHRVLARVPTGHADVENLRNVLALAAAAGRTVKHSEYLKRMKDAEDDAIAALAKASG